MKTELLSLAITGCLILLGGCHKAVEAPRVATVEDVQAAQQDAQRQIAQARAEASKDVKSAAKVSGADAAVVKEAKATGAYDVAMTKADGDRKVAQAKCQTLQTELQKACTDQANADYDSTATAAKAARLAREQR